jgi:DNA mismatch repair ATPase MutS
MGGAGLGGYLDRRDAGDALSAVRLGPELARLAPREVLLSETLRAVGAGGAEAGAVETLRPRAAFDSAAAERRLCALWGVATLDGFGRLTGRNWRRWGRWSIIWT